MTIGQILADADARFAHQGGYRALADCDARRIDLIFRSPCGVESVVDTTPLPLGVAGEDVAHDLLAKRIGKEAASATYFVITFR